MYNVYTASLIIQDANMAFVFLNQCNTYAELHAESGYEVSVSTIPVGPIAHIIAILIIQGTNMGFICLIITCMLKLQTGGVCPRSGGTL